MSLLFLVLVLVAMGIGLWLINTKIPSLDGNIKTVINVVIVVAAVLFAANAFGFCSSGMQNMQVPQFNGK